MWQTWPVPHVVPSCRGVVASVQTGVPVPHASVPAWQRFVGVQLVPSLQATHLPAEHTSAVPQAVPSC